MRIVKIKDLANTIAAALFCPAEVYITNFEAKLNGYMPCRDVMHDSQMPDNDTAIEVDSGVLRVREPDMATSSQIHSQDLITENNSCGSHLALR